jgi:hypothetical protein
VKVKEAIMIVLARATANDLVEEALRTPAYLHINNQ